MAHVLLEQRLLSDTSPTTSIFATDVISHDSNFIENIQEKLAGPSQTLSKHHHIKQGDTFLGKAINQSFGRAKVISKNPPSQA